MKTHMESLKAKLHPSRFTHMSPKMAALVAAILGEDWATPAIDPPEIHITSDGFVTAGASDFVGTARDFFRNFKALLKAAGLTEEELSLWRECFAKHVTDWRRP